MPKVNKGLGPENDRCCGRLDHLANFDAGIVTRLRAKKGLQMRTRLAIVTEG